jgi:ABC-type Mn2+/Zn2+ transport system permease subunit
MNIVNAIVQNPVARTLVLLLLIIPISVYLGTIPVRRGILYYLGAFAPSVVMAIACGLWTWSWKWFWLVLAICVALTIATQALVYLFW